MVEVKNEEEIYRKLQMYLDSLPLDYPEANSGADIKILKRLFTPQEAEIALKLKAIPQDPGALFRPFKRKGWTLDQFSEALSTMGKKGSINWFKGKDGMDYYGIAFIIPGFYDYQIDRLTKELAEDIDQYIDEECVPSMIDNGTLVLRTIPVEKSISTEYHVSNFDEIKSVIENIKTTIFLSPCICRQSAEVRGIGCDHPIETCITIGRANPRIYLEQGREITQEEAIQVLRDAQNNGMIVCPTNAQKPIMICCCCRCSCIFLKNLKKFENPSLYVDSNYFVEVDEKSCSGCGDCVTTCHMDAININEKGIAEVNLGYCLGCGVCIPACPEDARHLIKKDNEYIPPENYLDLLQVIGKKKKIIREKRKTDKNYSRVKKIK
jgi:Pyruvate/2-oxoacid:ferredoxin oxidoreductase delta subunit